MTIKGLFQFAVFLASFFPAIWLVFDMAGSHYPAFLNINGVLNAFPAIYFLIVGSSVHFILMIIDGFKRKQAGWIVAMLFLMPLTGWLYYLLVYAKRSGHYPSFYPDFCQKNAGEWYFFN